MEDTENSDKFDKFDFGVDFFAPPFSLAIVGDQEISKMWRILYFQRTTSKCFDFPFKGGCGRLQTGWPSISTRFENLQNYWHI